MGSNCGVVFVLGDGDTLRALGWGWGVGVGAGVSTVDESEFFNGVASAVVLGD